MARFNIAVATLLALIFAAVSAQELLTNSIMDGCSGGLNPLTSWNGVYDNARSFAASADLVALTALTITTPSVSQGCAAVLTTESTAYTQTFTIIPSQVGGNFDFSIYYACSAVDGFTGNCAFSLEINDVPVSVTGTASKASLDEAAAFEELTVTGTVISTSSVTVELICTVTGENDFIFCFLDDASLTYTGGGSGDPHFRGWNGQIFDFQGTPKQSYNLISDVDLQVNVMLDTQRTGPHSLAGGVVMKTMALFTPEHTIIANAGGNFKEEFGFVTLDGVKIQEDQKIVTEDGVSISFNKVDAKASHFGIDSIDHVAFVAHIEFEGSYKFVIFFVENHFNPNHPDAPFDSLYYRRFIDFESSLLDQSRNPSGILGQTAHLRSEDKGRSLKDWQIQGSEFDYQLKDGLMGTNFAFNKFSA